MEGELGDAHIASFSAAKPVVLSGDVKMGWASWDCDDAKRTDGEGVAKGEPTIRDRLAPEKLALETEDTGPWMTMDLRASDEPGMMNSLATVRPFSTTLIMVGEGSKSREASMHGWGRPSKEVETLSEENDGRWLGEPDKLGSKDVEAERLDISDVRDPSGSLSPDALVSDAK